MTIDERLEKPTERTDAIVRSVELLTSLHLDNERRHAEFMARSEERFAKNEERTAQLMGGVNHLRQTMNRLIVIRHEERLGDLENRPN